MSEKWKGGNEKVDAEKYKHGKMGKEDKLVKYNEKEGNANKYNDKGGHKGKKYTHKGKKKKVSYKKGDKHKKFKTKKVCDSNNCNMICKCFKV